MLPETKPFPFSVYNVIEICCHLVVKMLIKVVAPFIYFLGAFYVYTDTTFTPFRLIVQIWFFWSLYKFVYKFEVVSSDEDEEKEEMFNSVCVDVESDPAGVWLVG